MEQYGAVAAALEQASQSQIEHNATVEREIARVVSCLEECGIQPVLIKGIAVARLYPTALIRPAGDIDLVVPDTDYAAAQEALADVQISFHRDHVTIRRTSVEDMTSPIDVDLHRFSSWDEGSDDDFFTEAQTVHVHGTDVHSSHGGPPSRALFALPAARGGAPATAL
jgi:hypothetical protein